MGGEVAEHGHHGHHGPKVPAVPDYRIYKVEDVPRLVKLRDALAREGLKDPWMRNEVWRYSSFTKINNWGLAKALITRGMKPGFILAVATVVLEKAYDFAFAKDHHHHHQDEGHQ
ncbi:NADH dehydrogenase [ubiquinone] 1 beta subcomplex subunit 3 [Dermacentor andersoni]|uniref:NADH dehydrogenase [ubiquinone] 1 beta subcomplex subunit 3 n=1 Tax=Dermacentor andersoni TaxID=34620 RepID=UPI0021558168|nr:NADH dehydrogenase [ubiquinone] 1 beta subcomplex subunit 3-like [Dermacentor andersoni]